MVCAIIFCFSLSEKAKETKLVLCLLAVWFDDDAIMLRTYCHMLN